MNIRLKLLFLSFIAIVASLWSISGQDGVQGTATTVCAISAKLDRGKHQGVMKTTGFPRRDKIRLKAWDDFFSLQLQVPFVLRARLCVSTSVLAVYQCGPYEAPHACYPLRGPPVIA